MKTPFILVLLMLFVSGCSTVDRVVYYSPISGAGEAKGPEPLRQGFLNFGGEADSYKEEGIKVAVSQRVTPYLWGPWFVAVIPVFPFTLIAELFRDEFLVINLSSKDVNLLEKLHNKNNFSIVYFDGKLRKEVFPSKLHMNKGYTGYAQLTFPVSTNDISSFAFHIHSKEGKFDKIKVKYELNSRWRWKQYVING